MKQTATALALALGLGTALIGLDLLAQVIANALAPLGAIPALIFFGALFTALIRFTK